MSINPADLKTVNEHLIPPHSHVKITQPSLSLRILRTIFDVASTVFSALCFWNWFPFKLSDHQVKIINSTKLASKIKPKDEDSEAADSIKSKGVTLISSPSASKPQKAQAGNQYDPSLENMRDFIKEFVGITQELVFKEKILPAVENFKDSGKIPDGIKLFFKTVITIGNKASKPLFQMFHKTGNKGINAGNSSKQDENDPIVVNLLKWLIKDVKSTQAQDRFENDLKAKTKDLKLPEGHTFENYFTLINQWLFSENHDKQLAIIGEGKSLNEEVLESFREAALTLLAEYKIDHYFKVVDNTLKDKLPKIIQKTLETNSSKLTDILSARLADLLKHTNYSMTIDRLLLAALEQTQGYLLAEKGAAVHEELIADAKKAVAVKPSDESEKSVQQTCQGYLAEVNKVGEDQFKYKKFIETYAATLINKNAAQMPHGIQSLKEILVNYGTDKKLLDHAVDTVAIPKIASQIAKEIVELMLPGEKKDGKGQKADSLTELWIQLSPPPEFQELLDHAKEIAFEILTPESAQKASSFKDAAVALGHDVAFSAAKTYLKKAMTAGLEKVIELIASPRTLKEMVAKAVLPAIKDKMLQSFSSKMILQNTKLFAPCFVKLSNNPDAKVRSEIFSHINEEAYKLAKEATHQFSFKDEGITLEKFGELLSPIVEDIERVFIEIKNDPKRKSPTIEIKEATAVIVGFYNSFDNSNNPICGQLIEDLACKVGKFDGLAETILQFAKDDIGEMMYSTLYNYKISHHALVDTLVESLKSNKGELTDLVKDALKKPDSAASEETKKSPEEFSKESDAKFQEQIKKIAMLSHDYIFYSLGNLGGGFITKPIAKTIVGKDAGKLDKAIQECYQKLFGQKFLNLGLIVKLKEVVFDELEKSSARAAKQKHLMNKAFKVNGKGVGV